MVREGFDQLFIVDQAVLVWPDSLFETLAPKPATATWVPIFYIMARQERGFREVVRVDEVTVVDITVDLMNPARSYLKADTKPFGRGECQVIRNMPREILKQRERLR